VEATADFGYGNAFEGSVAGKCPCGWNRMSAISILSGFNRVRLERLADWLAVGVAASLPWSRAPHRQP